jgi:hypothetical protein
MVITMDVYSSNRRSCQRSRRSCGAYGFSSLCGDKRARKEPLGVDTLASKARLIKKSCSRRDENKLQTTSSDAFWIQVVRALFSTEEGLGTLQSVIDRLAIPPCP